MLVVNYMKHSEGMLLMEFQLVKKVNVITMVATS